MNKLIANAYAEYCIENPHDRVVYVHFEDAFIAGYKKAKQEELLTEIMKEDENSGMYE